jgi:hypothetical protein
MIQIRPETRAYRTPILRDMRPARTSTRIPFRAREVLITDAIQLIGPQVSAHLAANHGRCE